MKTFNEQKYKQQYNKEHYKVFKVDLKIEEWNQLDKILKEKKITKAEFLRKAIKELEK